MRKLILLVVLCGCGGDEDFTDCRLGGLSGSWRLSYDETDGNCGPIQDETTILTTEENPVCTYYANQVSADRCELDTDFECPTTDDAGTQRWVIHVEHVEAELVTGSGTVMLDHPNGTCRSTYDLTMRKL